MHVRRVCYVYTCSFTLKGYLVEAMRDKMKSIRNAIPWHKKAREMEEAIVSQLKNQNYIFQDIL